jgi:hypothetical protein
MKGINDASCFGVSKGSNKGVSTTAGAIALTRILSGANSIARLRVKLPPMNSDRGFMLKPLATNPEECSNSSDETNSLTGFFCGCAQNRGADRAILLLTIAQREMQKAS